MSAYCSVAWGLRTDYPPKKEPNPFPADPIGVAWTGKQNVETFVQLDQKSREHANLVSFLRPIFHGLEEELIQKEIAKGEPTSNGRLSITGHPTDSKERARMDFSSVKVLQGSSGGEGPIFYYVTAIQRYRTGGDDALSIFNGWTLKSRAGEFNLVEKVFNIGRQDSMKGPQYTPLVVLTSKSQPYFLLYETSEANEAVYRIVEFDGSRLQKRLRTSGGGCGY